MKQERVEMLAIGDEILDGRVVDTNSVRAAIALGSVGLHIVQRTAITDDLDVIAREAHAIAERGTSLCVVSGGLGPTADDLTAEAMALALGVPLVRDEAQAQKIRRYLEGRGRTVSDNQLTQADRPKSARVIENDVGTAPGFEITLKGCRFVAFPGVPKEFDALLETSVVAPLRANRKPLLRRALYTFGLMEAEVDRRLEGHRARFPEVRLQFRVKFPEVHVTMHATDAHERDLDAAWEYAKAQLDPHIYATREISLAEATLEALRSRGMDLAVAESCTGGLITDLVTDVSGSSDVLHVGVTAYDNAAKINFLGVKKETIAKHGAVSEQAVIEMADGVRKLVGSTFGVAVSGIAGPGGGTTHKPVGTLWIGVSTEDKRFAKLLQLPHDRRGNKVAGAYVALDLVRRTALGLETDTP